jgi:hypothetical protein
MGTWRYGIVERDGLYQVCEEYLDASGKREAWCETTISSESPEGLVEVLEMVLADVERAAGAKRVIHENIDPNPLLEEQCWDNLLKGPSGCVLGGVEWEW